MDQQNIPATKARQGRWGSSILVVLVISLALAMIVWVGLEFYGESIDSQGQDSAAPTTSAPAPQP